VPVCYEGGNVVVRCAGVGGGVRGAGAGEEGWEREEVAGS